MSSGFKNIPGQGILSLSSSSEAIVISGQGDITVSLDPQLLSASSVVQEYTVGEVISALKVGYRGAGGLIHKADLSSLTKASPIGIALNAALPGGKVRFVQYGLLTDDSLNLTPGQLIFLGNDGSIVTEAPQAGYLTRLGRAIDYNIILVIIDSPIVL